MEIFQQAYKFWVTNDHTRLSELAIRHIDQALNYVRENPLEVEERAGQLDAAITRFNQKRKVNDFGDDEVCSKKLAEEILGPNEILPLLAEMPTNIGIRFSFFAGFLNLIYHHYYTFVDRPEIADPKLLITGLLVDGYGFSLRAKRIFEKKPTIGKDDLIIVNAICEMTEPGTLQTEMYLANWFKPDYGLSQDFCDMLSKQFGDLKPIQS